MIRCECYPNHEICKNKNTCEFWIPLNQKLKQLNQQISYELKILESLNQRKRDYFKILSEIQRERYTEIVAIDGRLKRVPKKNARGESILKPDDVQVGLNFNVISKEITDTETIIHELRIREKNILKILFIEIPVLDVPKLATKTTSFFNSMRFLISSLISVLICPSI